VLDNGLVDQLENNIPSNVAESYYETGLHIKVSRFIPRSMRCHMSGPQWGHVY
jgi:hypothetical protein